MSDYGIPIDREQMGYAAGRRAAERELTDLIKDMLPYLKHTDDCKMWKDWDRYGAVHDCDCGVDMILQRINERSK